VDSSTGLSGSVQKTIPIAQGGGASYLPLLLTVADELACKRYLFDS
jgi:hypothetical protein